MVAKGQASSSVTASGPRDRAAPRGRGLLRARLGKRVCHRHRGSRGAEGGALEEPGLHLVPEGPASRAPCRLTGWTSRQPPCGTQGDSRGSLRPAPHLRLLTTAFAAEPTGPSWLEGPRPRGPKRAGDSPGRREALCTPGPAQRCSVEQDPWKLWAAAPRRSDWL